MNTFERSRSQVAYTNLFFCRNKRFNNFNKLRLERLSLYVGLGKIVNIE